MRERGRRQAERLVDQYLARGVGQVVVAAEDMRDAHVSIVADHGEIVRRATVGAHEDHIVHDVSRERNRAVHRIVEGDGAVVTRHLKAPHVRLAGFDAPRRLGGVEVAACTIISLVCLTCIFGCLALGIEFLFGAEARIHRTALLQALERLGVGTHALHLEIRTGIAAHFGSFVPREPQPLHRVQDDVDVFFRGTLGIGVLDAQNEIAAHGARERPIEDRGARSADVKAPRWRGRETNSYLIGHDSSAFACFVKTKEKYSSNQRP